MPEFDDDTRDKITLVRGLRTLGTTIEVHEMVKVEWPSPTGTVWYAVHQTDEVASVEPPVSPIETRLIPESSPDWFLPVQLDATIGDEEIDLKFEDFDEGMSGLVNTHGEGVKASLFYWFPQVELLLDVWHGHLEYGEEETVEYIVLKASQGFRSADADVPGRGHYQHCSAVFGGLLETQDEIDEHDCPYNKHIGGSVGNNNPLTGLPWTYCDRRDTASCTARGINVLFHLSHKTIVNTVQINQTHGPNLLSTSQGNETNLAEPVRVILSPRRMYDMKVMAFRRDLNSNHHDQGFFLAQYEGPEGPQASISLAQFTVGGKTQNANPQHFNYRLGTKGQSPISFTGLTPHGYSGTAFAYYNFGPIDPSTLGPGDASASAMWGGLSDIRVYTDEDTFTETTTSNRAWHLMRLLCDKRWGYGLDYDRLNIQSFIDAAAWCGTTVRFTDTFGAHWDHVRAASYPELIGKKVQQQVEDLCMAGRLSRPFLFDGKIHVVPLAALTAPELAACPVFTDEGDEPNIVRDQDGKTSLKIGKRKSVKELINRVEANYDNAANAYLQTPLRPVEDVDAQLAAGRLTGDFSRKVNKKDYPLLGVTVEAQAIKMAWSLLDLGPHDEGGLQNNLPIVLQVWFADAIDLHQDKVIKVVSSRLTKYGFTYFRIKRIKRQTDLIYELECQAYNETYMATFEGEVGGGACSVDDDCDPGYECVGGVCVPIETVCLIDEDCPPGFWCVDGECVPAPPPCRPGFGTVRYIDGVLEIDRPICPP